MGFMNLISNVVQSMNTINAMNTASLPRQDVNQPQQTSIKKVSMHDYMLMQYKKFGGETDPQFPEGPYIFGVRNESDIKNDLWNDIIGILYNGKIYCAIATTDPGVYWTFHRMNPRGCFHLKNCYHPNIWCVGLHRGYKALINSGDVGVVKGWRDSNNDFLYDEGEDDTGVFAVDFHHGFNSPKIGQHSAGCQVIQSTNVFNFYLDKIINSRKVKTLGVADARFSYMLFDISQVPYDKLMQLAKEPMIGF